MPSRSKMVRISRARSSRRVTSKLENGSSSNSNFGRGASARASATRCCCPPDQVWVTWRIRPARPAGGRLGRGAGIAPPSSRAQGDVLRDSQMRKQRVLEHQADPPLFRRQGPPGPAEFDAFQPDRALLHRLEAGDGAQQRGLAATAGTEQAADAGADHPQRQVLNHPPGRIGDGDVGQVKERRHIRVSHSPWHG